MFQDVSSEFLVGITTVLDIVFHWFSCLRTAVVQYDAESHAR